MKDRVKAKEPKTKSQLKKVITAVWREIDSDKALCRRLIQSIPFRLEAVVAAGGSRSGRKTTISKERNSCILCTNSTYS